MSIQHEYPEISTGVKKMWAWCKHRCTCMQNTAWWI